MNDESRFRFWRETLPMLHSRLGRASNVLEPGHQHHLNLMSDDWLAYRSEKQSFYLFLFPLAPFSS